MKKVSNFFLVLALLPIFAIQIVNPETAAAATCVAGAAAQNNIEVEPSHGKVLYIDTGVSPRIDGAYIGYRVKNTTGATISGWWVSLTNFSGGVVDLANTSDKYMQLPTITNGSTKTVYFLLKATASTKVAQTHTVTVYNGRPDVSGSTSKYTCDFSFTKVAETIKAAANKVTSITIDNSTPAIGQLVSVTVKGATGTIGAGSADVGKILWFSPSAFANFPTAAVRLESVLLQIGDNQSVSASGSNKAWTYSERLLVTSSITPDTGIISGSETTADTLGSKRYYENVYKFRILNRTASNLTFSPVAQISSGTQIKHTDLSQTPSSTLTLTSAPTNLTVTKSVTSTSGLTTASCGGSTCNVVPYRIRLSASSGTITIDEVVDTPGSGVTYKSGSVAVSSGSISAPVQLTSESSLNPQPYHFIGPFTVTSGTNLDITYQMLVPQTANATFTNNAVAYIGTLKIGASASTISNVTVTNNSSGGVSTATSGTITIDPIAVTYGATSITSSGATLNGTVDANGQTPSAQFELSTNANLATYTAVSLSASVSGSDPTPFTATFAGTAGTTYYYRIVAIKSGVRYEGSIVSFTVIENATASVATTNIATSILTQSATLNGSIDPNLQTISEVRFVYGINSDLSGTTTSKILNELNEDGTESTTKVTLTGANPIDLNYVIPAGSLLTSTTYYFRIEGDYTSGTLQTVRGSILSFKTGTNSQTITFGAISSKTFASDTFTATASASSNLAITYTSENTDICTVDASTGVITFVKAGFCLITASQPGNTTYAAAEPVTQQFEITPSAPTATTQAASSVSKNSAVINGAVTTGGGGSTTTTFQWGTDSGLSGASTVTAAQSPRTTDGAGSYTLSGLTAGTTYYFRIIGTNSTGTANGNILNFSTTASSAITLDADDKSKNYGATTPAFTYTITSGSLDGGDTITALTYTFANLDANTPAYGPTSTAPTEAGSYSISISAATFNPGPAGNYTVTYTTGTYTINKINQSALSLTDRTLSQSTTYTLLATGGSGTGAISYVQSSNTFTAGNCSIASTDQLTTPAEDGTCTITATKAGDRNYNQATANGLMTINSNLAQTITFPTISDRNFSAIPFTHSSTTASSTLDVTLTSNTTSVCTVNSPVNSGTVPTITMVSAGTCSITASQGGGTVSSNTYNAASPLTRTFVINKLNQIINFPAISDKLTSDSDVDLPATTDANVNITYTTNDSSICTITGSAGSYKVDVVGVGTCIVTASAVATSIYNAATDAIRSFNISAPATVTTGGGGGAPVPTPVYVPTPPTIIAISATEVCAVGEDLIITGTNLNGATASIDGASARVISTSNSSMRISLPMAIAGVRTLRVTNADGSASTTVKYTFVDIPVYVNYTYPIVYKDLGFSYTFSATDAVKYSIQGRLPAGLTINPLTGEILGTPTVDGEFTFTIIASNVCGSAYLNVSMFIDKAVPEALTCTVLFNVPNSDLISPAKLSALRNCMDKVLKLSPSSIDPVIFLSGGVAPGLTQEELINHPRYSAICELLNSMGVVAQIIVGAFDGELDQVQVMIYWPEPLDV